MCLIHVVFKTNRNGTKEATSKEYCSTHKIEFFVPTEYRKPSTETYVCPLGKLENRIRKLEETIQELIPNGGQD